MSRRNPRTASRLLAASALKRPASPSPSPDSIQEAWALFGSGEQGKAESLCRSLLARSPDHAGALSLLGIMMAQAGRTREAASLLGLAAARLPHEPTVHNNHGNALRELGDLTAALGSYDRALALNPEYAEAHFNLGLTLHDIGRYEDALASYDRAIILRPRYAAAWNNRGTTCRVLGRLDEALVSFDRAIAERSDHAESHNNRGVALHELDRFDEALASFERALSLRPAHARAFNNRGATLLALDRFEEALASFERALAVEPRYAEAMNNRGVALQRLERFKDAVASFELALTITPDYAEALNNLGVSLTALERHLDALVSYERALQINPQYPDALRNQGAALHRLGRFDQALASHEHALMLRRDAETYRNHAATLYELRRPEEAIASFERALSLDPDTKFLPGACHHARMQICDWSHFDADLAQLSAAVESERPAITPFMSLSLFDSPGLLRKTSEIYAREECSPRVTLPSLGLARRHDRIRLGYFSADFRNHAVSALIAGLIEAHDRAKFEVTAFALGPDVQDELRARLAAAFDRFVPVGGKSDLEIATLARQLEIDIAIDLGGYTQDARPRVLALRSAPIQVSYLGYLGTMGSPFIDYLIADRVLVPPESRLHYAEKIAYLPSYQVNDSNRPEPERVISRAELGLPSTGFVFCCFNASYKITPEVFASWMRIVAAVPDSVLFLLGDHPAVQRNLRQSAAHHGIAPDRLIFSRRLAFGDYLARYRAADLFLDTSPYNAGTTASDALWAHLPVLTCPGENFAGRMAASILTAARLPELVAVDRPDYERRAIALATSPTALAKIRQRLAETRSTSPLFHTHSFARSLEALYEAMYERHLAGAPPDHLLHDGSNSTPSTSIQHYGNG